jgi:hypothetical protein
VIFVGIGRCLDKIVLGLYARGMSTRDITDHLAEIFAVAPRSIVFPRQRNAVATHALAAGRALDRADDRAVGRVKFIGMPRTSR